MTAGTLCEITGILILGVIFYQDIKDRAVSWILFPLLFGIYVIRFLYEAQDFIYPVFNYAFITIQLMAILVYVSLKYKSTQLFKKYLGLGDILFWVSIAWFFSPLNFILYHVVGLLIAVLLSTVFSKTDKKTIPLAGLQSLLLIALTVASWMIPSCGTFNDSYILMILQ